MKSCTSLSKRQLRRRIEKTVVATINNLETSVSDQSTATFYHDLSAPDLIADSFNHDHQVELDSEIYDIIDDDEIISEPSSSDFSSDSEVEDNQINEELRKWAIENNVTNSATSSLLKILKKHSCFSELPADARSLLSTRRHFIKRDVLPGAYAHFGLENGVKSYVNQLKVVPEVISLLIGIDGIPISKSSKSEYCPILASIFQDRNYKPFCVGIYQGSSKPNDQNEYLQDFVAECKQLLQTGILVKNKLISVQIKGFICDAPARAFITCTKYYSGFSACSKCTQVGERYENRTVFSDKIASRRTDANFGNSTSLEDDHHRGFTILSELGIGLVSKLPLESMHLIYLGVVKKILNLWVGGKPKYLKFSAFQISTISDNLSALRFHMCCEFNRQPRSLVELPRWKATELRQFLLYTGFIVLHNILPPNYLTHFLSLHCAAAIYSNDELIASYGDYADQLLNFFVVEFSALYGKENLFYNVHGLLHVYEDVKMFGNINNYSAFSFENHLGILKRLTKSGFSPLSQICGRISERESSSPLHIQRQELKHIHRTGPLINGYGSPQYKTFVNGNFILKINKRDQFVQMRTGELVKVRNFATDLESVEVWIIGHACLKTAPLYTSPCNSELLGIFTFSKFGPLKKFPLSDISLKMVFSVFPETDEVEVTPDSWLDREEEGRLKCWWPPYKNSDKVKTAVKNQSPVNLETWNIYNARILRCFATYAAAREHLSTAAWTSNLESEVEENDEGSRRSARPRALNIEYEESLSGSSGELSSFSKPAAKDKMKANFPPPPVIFTNRSKESSLALTNPGFVLAPGSEITPFEKHVVKELAELRQRMDLLTTNVRMVYDLYSKGSPSGRPEKIDYGFPFDTMEAFNELETSIQDKKMFQQLIVELKEIGGTNYKENITNIMTRMMTYNLGSKFCWEGIRKINPKRAFKHCKIKDAISAAVKDNRNCAGVTDSDIKIKLASWFQHAPEKNKSEYKES
ncbi:hypothetical protein Fcan01_26743 [Folsomia candida]|uniref:DUF4806 domain-containing protein n=1 Tax=Folsomia candida TaxID=158441 RepID=A0A226D128_FOLCA|nr:hypothetical protein Fcan01_26743 [Folsomia candida]